MGETGWPLIPREGLPAPVRPARPASRRPPGTAPAAPSDAGRQLSIFGAETTEPSPADLAGLLAGPGRLGRMGGTARVSVTVDAAWRVHVLVAELVSRGLVVSWAPAENPDPRKPAPPNEDPANQDPANQDPADPDPTDPDPADIDPADPDPTDPDPADPDPTDPGPEDQDSQDPDPDVRTTPVPEAEPTSRPQDDPRTQAPPADDTDSADVPPPGAGHARPAPPAGFEVRTAYSSRLAALARDWPPPAGRLFLSGPGLRLWVAAAGAPVDGGYALGLAPGDAQIAEAALVRAGLAGTVSEAGTAYVIVGRKRLARLAELVGERPAAAPVTAWPGAAAA